MTITSKSNDISTSAAASLLLKAPARDYAKRKQGATKTSPFPWLKKKKFCPVALLSNIVALVKLSKGVVAIAIYKIVLSKWNRLLFTFSNAL